MNAMSTTNASTTTLLLREPLRVKFARLFYEKTAVELVSLSAGAAAFTSPAVTMLSIKRAAIFGGDISIPLDASIQPTRLVRSAKDAAKCTFSIVFGLANKMIRIRAPSIQAYEEWRNAIGLALKSAAAVIANKTSSRIATIFIADNSNRVEDAKCIGTGNKSASSSTTWRDSSAETASSETSDYSDEFSSSSSDYSTDYATHESTDAGCITAPALCRALVFASPSPSSSNTSLFDEVELLLNTVDELNQWTLSARQHRLGIQTRITEAVQFDASAASKHAPRVQSHWI